MGFESGQPDRQISWLIGNFGQHRLLAKGGLKRGAKVVLQSLFGPVFPDDAINLVANRWQAEPLFKSQSPQTLELARIKNPILFRLTQQVARAKVPKPS